MADQEKIPPQGVSPDQRFSDETRAWLRTPLDPRRVAMDPRNNPYLEGWDVIGAANWGFGYDGWSTEVIDVRSVYTAVVSRGSGQNRRDVEVALYQATVALTAGGVRRVDVGTSVTSDERLEAHETAIKGAVTDAIKRALRTFGAQFGNDLYDKGRTGDEPAHEAQHDPQPPAQAAQPATPRPTKERTVGDFLTWCASQHKLKRSDVFGILGVTDVKQITDLAASTRAIEAHVQTR